MRLSEFLMNEGIGDISALPLEKCKVTKERLIFDAPEECYAVMLVLPYPVRKRELFASFSLTLDYHLFFSELEKKLSVFFSEKYPFVYMKVFADHSPIDERLAACNAALGVLGDNGLFISEKFGSFVFIGEIICSLSEKELNDEGIGVCFVEKKGCLHCGACEGACPAGVISSAGSDKARCVSALTQKKGDLSDTEKYIIKKSGYVWGCDACALVCPMNDRIEREAAYCEFFTAGAISPKSFEDIDRMSKEEYGKYPFSWRKKDILRRNFDIFDL